MVTLQQINDYSELLVQDLGELNTLKRAVDIDHINAGLKNVSSKDNDILYLMVPEFDDDIVNQDLVNPFTFIDWFVMRKVSERGGHDAFMDSFIETQATCMSIRQHIFETAQGKRGDACGGWLRRIYDGGGLSIKPVYHISQMAGWHIVCSLKSFG